MESQAVAEKAKDVKEKADQEAAFRKCAERSPRPPAPRLPAEQPRRGKARTLCRQCAPNGHVQAVRGTAAGLRPFRPAARVSRPSSLQRKRKQASQLIVKSINGLLTRALHAVFPARSSARCSVRRRLSASVTFVDDDPEVPGGTGLVAGAAHDDIDEFEDPDGDDLGGDDLGGDDLGGDDLGGDDLGGDDLGGDDLGGDQFGEDDAEFADAPAVPDAEFDQEDELGGDEGDLDDVDGGDLLMDEEFDEDNINVRCAVRCFPCPVSRVPCVRAAVCVWCVCVCVCVSCRSPPRARAGAVHVHMPAWPAPGCCGNPPRAVLALLRPHAGCGSARMHTRTHPPANTPRPAPLLVCRTVHNNAQDDDAVYEDEAEATMATENNDALMTDEEEELTEAAPAVPDTDAAADAAAEYDAEHLDDDDDDELDDVEASYDDVAPVEAAPKANPNAIMIERLDA